ncbi:MAG: leucine-rich repeat protein [Clostridia bacterium]|nr:leucine-rich repeat protein [Clostridia bacterium]
MKKRARVLSMLVAAIMLLSVFGTFAFADDGPRDVTYDGVIYRIDGGTASVIGYNGEDGKVVIHDTVLGAAVNWIRDHAFNTNSNVVSLVIEATKLNAISAGAFANCRNLKSVELSDSVTAIYENAFLGCTSLLAIDLKNVRYVGYQAFMDCHHMQSIRFACSGKLEIGNRAFYACRNLGSIEWPENADEITIAENAFIACTALESITFPEQLTSIGMKAFFQCLSLKSVDFSKAVRLEYIPVDCFRDCESIEELVIPGNIRTISGFAFSECVSIGKVMFMNGVTDIASQSFSKSSSIEKIFLPTSVRSVSSSVFDTFKTATFYCTNEDQMNRIKKSGANNYEYALCADGFHGPDAEHEFDETMEYIVKPTYTTEGTVAYKCSICGAVKRTETAPKLTTDISYPDVTEDKWFYNQVLKLSDMGVFSGMEDGTFAPDTALTRGMVAVMMFKLTGNSDYEVTSNPFNDVSADDWYYKAVAWAYDKGVVSGMGDGVFAPKEPISRQQLCVMIKALASKYYGKTLINTARLFDDDVMIASWAKDPVYCCRTAGIVSGMTGNVFSPISSVTRAQAAVMFSALSDLVG